MNIHPAIWLNMIVKFYLLRNESAIRSGCGDHQNDTSYTPIPHNMYQQESVLTTTHSLRVCPYNGSSSSCIFLSISPSCDRNSGKKSPVPYPDYIEIVNQFQFHVLLLWDFSASSWEGFSCILLDSSSISLERSVNETWRAFLNKKYVISCGPFKINPL